MENLTANEDRALDQFHADMVVIGMLDTVDMMEQEDRDYTPMPREFWGMSWAQIVEEIQEYETETSAYWDNIRALGGRY